MEPLVRIVMSTKNRERLLPRAINSIRRQTMRAWELIVIDDNSTDGTHGIIRNYCLLDGRIRAVVNTDKRLGGFSWEKQKHMLEANTSYICILDDDDFWEPTYLERCIDVLEKAKECSMVYTDCYLVSEKGEVRLENTSKGYPFPDVLPSLCVFRTQTFKSLGAWDLDFFNHNGKIIHAEIDFYLKLRRTYEPIHITKPLVSIYRTTTSMGAPRELSAHGNLKIMERWEEELKADKRCWAAFNCRVGINLEEAGMEGSKKYFIEAIRSKPLMVSAWGALVISLLGHKNFVRVYKRYRNLVGFDGKVISKVEIKDGLW